MLACSRTTDDDDDDASKIKSGDTNRISRSISSVSITERAVSTSTRVGVDISGFETTRVLLIGRRTISPATGLNLSEKKDLTKSLCFIRY